MKTNSSLHLSKNIFKKDVERANTRDGYGNGLVEAGKRNENVIVICADLSESTRSEWFAKEFPNRFVQIGVAEQNMATVASGMASTGKVVFISSYAAFSPGRNNEQIRTTISYNSWGAEDDKKINVKIAGAHAGISVGPDAGTHQALEDIALMRVQPGMVVIAPSDVHEAERATIALAENPGPAYMRFGRASYPVVTTPKTPFEIGKAYVYKEGRDVTIVANGPLVHTSFVVAEKLEKENISCEIINCPTVKPLDGKTIEKSVRKTNALVTAEEHQVTGGLGSAIAEYLSQTYPTIQEFIGVQDRFGESGDPLELFDVFGMGEADLEKAVRNVIKKKEGNTPQTQNHSFSKVSAALASIRRKV